MLELHNLYFTVPDGEESSGGLRNIIDGIDFTFDDGKFYVITGPNGSGKTTLAKLIMGINPVTSIVEAFKYGTMGVGTFSWGMLGYSFAFMTVLLGAGIIIFNKVQRSFMDTV